MPGPLVSVKTITASIGLTIGQNLNLGPAELEFMVPDDAEVTKWRTIKVITTGFNRVPPDREVVGDARIVVFRVADLDGDLAEVLRNKGLNVLCQNEQYEVTSAPEPEPTEAQVFDITCNKRTLRTRFFDSRR